MGLLGVAAFAFTVGKQYVDQHNTAIAFSNDCIDLDSPACNWACKATTVNDPSSNPLRVCEWCSSPPPGADTYCVNASGALPITNDETCGLPDRIDGCSDCMYDAGDSKALIGACAAAFSISMALACLNCCAGECLCCCSCCCFTAGCTLVSSSLALFATVFGIKEGSRCDRCAQLLCGCCGSREDEAEYSGLDGDPVG